MMTAFDTDGILFNLLRGKTSIEGNVYVGDDRPENSLEEDIVINTIDMPVECLPQTPTSNINIYAKDTTRNIGGDMQVKSARQRLEVLTNEVLTLLREARIEGLKFVPGTMAVNQEPYTKQHFVNIRVDWNIQII